MDSDFFSLCLVVVPFLQPLVLFAFALNLAANEIRSPPVRIQIMGWCWGIYALLSRGTIGLHGWGRWVRSAIWACL